MSNAKQWSSDDLPVKVAYRAAAGFSPTKPVSGKRIMEVCEDLAKAFPILAAAPGLLEACRQSTAWVAKLIADRPDNDPTGIRARASRHLAKLEAEIAKADGRG